MTPLPGDTAVAVTTPAADPMAGAESLLSQAITAGASIDTVERIMALRKDILAEKAKQAFNEAMAAFQQECPVIEKKKAVNTRNGQTAYKYAPIDSIVEQVKDCVKKHGFRYATTMEFGGEKVKVFCRVVHTLGHEEVSVMEIPLGNKTEIMSQSQVVAAASTFAKRYAFLNAFGIMTGDEDNDTASEREDQGNAPQATPQAALTETAATPPKKFGLRIPFNMRDANPSPNQMAFFGDVWAQYMTKRQIVGLPQRQALLHAFLVQHYEVESLQQIRKPQVSDAIDHVKELIKTAKPAQGSTKPPLPQSPTDGIAPAMGHASTPAPATHPGANAGHGQQYRR